MRQVNMNNAKFVKLALGMALVAALAACGGGGGGSDPAPVKVAATNTTANVTALTVPALVTTPAAVASFPAGFGSITGATTISFAGATPTFTITNGVNTASGPTTFASCILTVTATSFAPGSGLDVGDVLTFNPCTLTATTTGVTANGVAVPRTVVLRLVTPTSDATSNPFTLNVRVDPDGKVYVGTPGTYIGTVTLTTASGAGT